MELFHYGANRIPFIRFYKLQLVYAVKLKEGWGPKVPDDVPNEIKVLLRRCFQYNIEDRASAEALLELIQQFVSFSNYGSFIIMNPIHLLIMVSSFTFVKFLFTITIIVNYLLLYEQPTNMIYNPYSRILIEESLYRLHRYLLRTVKPTLRHVQLILR